MTKGEWSGEQIAQDLGNSQVRDQILQRLEAHAHVLRNKLPEAKRVGLLRLMCDVALSAGGIPEEEFEVLDHLRQLLGIRGEFAQAALDKAKREARADSGQEPDEPRMAKAEASTEPEKSGDPLEAILDRAKLTEVALAHCRQACDQIRAQGGDLGMAVRSLLSWAVTASRRKGSLTQAQAKRLAVCAIKVCRDIQDNEGVARKGRGTQMDRQVQEHGIVAMFHRGEVVGRGPEGQPVIVLSVSRAKGTLVVAPQDNLDAAEEVEPCDLAKDPVNGSWPEELGGG